MGTTRIITHSDVASICSIYNYYIDHSPATFEEKPVSASDMSLRVLRTTEKYPWYVYESDNGEILGYAYATQWKPRSAYRFATEISVYISHEYIGLGIGTTLYKTLIADLVDRGFKIIIGGMTLPNTASQALHERLGFKKVAHFEKVGYKFGQWHDVGYWQYTVNNEQ